MHISTKNITARILTLLSVLLVIVPVMWISARISVPVCILSSMISFVSSVFSITMQRYPGSTDDPAGEPITRIEGIQLWDIPLSIVMFILNMAIGTLLGEKRIYLIVTLLWFPEVAVRFLRWRHVKWFIKNVLRELSIAISVIMFILTVVIQIMRKVCPDKSGVCYKWNPTTDTMAHQYMSAFVSSIVFICISLSLLSITALYVILLHSLKSIIAVLLTWESIIVTFVEIPWWVTLIEAVVASLGLLRSQVTMFAIMGCILLISPIVFTLKRNRDAINAKEQNSVEKKS